MQSDPMNAGDPPLPPSLYDELLAVLFGERGARVTAVDRLAARHPEHAAALRACLHRHEQLESADASAGASTVSIPGYRLLHRIGEGGMGEVFAAEQLEPLHRRVAIKLIKAGLDSRAVVARFQFERQTLAAMDHDAIARVFDCGTAPTGQPFFAMELVEGRPLHAYCDEHRLSLAERIALFQQVCAGVQHAHQKGVMHRDLKPGNVLVARQGERHVVKIIDFGVARATDVRATDGTTFTEQGVLLGTPEYMSPEQAVADRDRIDTRTDIYSLGVMLYELLVGELPFPAKELRAGGAVAMQERLRDVEPPKPSTRFATFARAAGASAAASRRSTPSSLLRSLRADLDWVVLKAIEKDPERRYESAAALAADLQRYLDHEPLLAGPPSVAYRLRKLVWRHRRLCLAAAAVFVTAIAGGVVAVGYALEAQAQAKLANDRADENGRLVVAESKARDEAEKSASRATAAEKAAEQRAAELATIAAFQDEQLRDVDPELMGTRIRRALVTEVARAAADAGQDEAAVAGRTRVLDEALAGVNYATLALVTLRENLFEGTLRAIDARFQDQPLLRARLLQATGETLHRMGLEELAIGACRTAHDLRLAGLGPGHRDTLASANDLGECLQVAGKDEEAEVVLRECVARADSALGETDPLTLGAMCNLARLLTTRGDYQESDRVLQRALQRAQAVQSPMLSDVATQLTALLTQSGKPAEAEVWCRKALEWNSRILGENDWRTLGAWNQLGMLLFDQGRAAEAESIFRDNVDRWEKKHGVDHPGTVMALHNFGSTIIDTRPDQAEALLRRALAVGQALYGPANRMTAGSTVAVGVALHNQGRFRDALPFLERGAESLSAISSPGSAELLAVRINLATTLFALTDGAKARRTLDEALAAARPTLGESHPTILEGRQLLSHWLRKEGKLEEAEAAMRLLDRDTQQLPAAMPVRVQVLTQLAHLLLEEQKFGEAEPYLRQLAAVTESSGQDPADALDGLAYALAATGKTAEAERLWGRVLSMLGALPDAFANFYVLSELPRLHAAQQRGADTERLFQAALDARRQRLPGQIDQTLATLLRVVGVAQMQQGKFAVAEATLRETLELDRQSSPDSPRYHGTMGLLGAAVAAQRRFADAEPLLVESLQKLGASTARASVKREACERLLKLYDDWGKPEQAAAVRKQLEGLPVGK